MKLSGLYSRVEPVILKAVGRLPLCPWSVVFNRLNPRTLNVFPPEKQIEVISRDGDFVQLRFAGKHDFWFPASTRLTLDLWNEYLSVFWNHPANAHYYLRGNMTIAAGDVVIDCGCCEGTFARQALELGASKVICLEPNAVLVKCLRRTFQGEIEEGRLIVCHAGCGAFRGQALFASDPSNPSVGLLGDKKGAEMVPVETLAAITVQLGLPQVNFIKMDIEGAEIQAVEGALPMLEKFHPKLAITTYHRNFDYASIAPLLIAVGYRNVVPTGLSVEVRGTRYRPTFLRAI